QNEHHVGPVVHDPIGSVNRDANARQVAPLLVRTTVHRIRQQIATDSREVQQRAALRGSSVPYHAPALALGLYQEFDELVFDSINARREAPVTVQSRKARLLLLRTHHADPGCWLPAGLQGGSVNPEA